MSTMAFCWGSVTTSIKIESILKAPILLGLFLQIFKALSCYGSNTGCYPGSCSGTD